MNKIFMSLLLVLALLLGGCRKMVPDKEGLDLYASFYPIYVLALGVAQDVPGVALRCLTQPQDGCPRAYQLSQWDAGLLSGADALILGGRGLESFAQALDGGSLPLIVAMAGLELGGEPTDAEAGHWAGENPWLFLDPAGAVEICRSLAGALKTLDPGRAQYYQQNLAAMEKRLSALASDMAVAEGGQVAVMHEGLIYLARAMNLTVCAQVEREPATGLEEAQLAEAIARIVSGGARAVLIERQAPQDLTDALRDAGLRVALIDTLTARSAPDGAVYFEAMAANARAVRDALSR